jgi:hypothetical protein
MLALNPNANATYLFRNDIWLENNLDKSCWIILSQNPNAEPLIFNLDYEKMKTDFQPIAKEIIEYVFHPTRLCRFAKMFNMNVDEYLELF